MLTRESFFSPDALAFQVEPVDSPLGRGYVRVMTAGEKDRIDVLSQKDPGKDVRAQILVATVCDESGHLLFGTGDIAAISRLPLTTIEPFVDAAIRINKMSQADQEELRKNSNGRNGISSSGSLATLAELSGNSSEE